MKRNRWSKFKYTQDKKLLFNPEPNTIYYTSGENIASVAKYLLSTGKEWTSELSEVKDGEGHYFSCIITSGFKWLVINTFNNKYINIDWLEKFNCETGVNFFLSNDYLKESFKKQLTPASISYDLCIKELGNRKDLLLPKLPLNTHKQIIKAYRGGICYIKKENHSEKDVYCYDISSSYPYVMGKCRLPIGEPLHRKEFKDFRSSELIEYDLQVFKVNCDIFIRKDGIPILQYRENHLCGTFITEEYDYTFSCTNIEFQLLQKHYNMRNIEIYDIYAFKSQKKLFKEFAKQIYDIKCNYAFVKPLANQCSGKFAQVDIMPVIEPIINERGELEVEFKDKKMVQTIYAPMSVFITAYGRIRLMKAYDYIKSKGGTVHYMDTDSIHFTSQNVKKILDSDDNIYFQNNKELGKFIFEHKGNVIYLKKKKYFIIDNEQNELIKIALAGEKIEHIDDTTKNKKTIYTYGAFLNEKNQMVRINKSYTIDFNRFKCYNGLTRYSK